jgi:molybdenum cofactor cytidylyltransferase
MSGVEGIVLAAGLSRRAGCNKMALKLGDRTVIQHSVDGMARTVSRVFVVVGWEAERIRELLVDYGNVEIVMNDDFRRGMFSSIKAGILRVQAPRFFLLPGDHPLVGVSVYRKMLATDGDIVIPTFQGRRGHPVLMDSHLIPDILHQPEDFTLRDFIHHRGYTTVEVDDRGIRLDIDTLSDYHTIRAAYAGSPPTSL